MIFTDPVLRGWRVLHRRFPLRKPYDLSFASVSTIDSVLVCVKDSNGAMGVGEAVPLAGYTEDTVVTIASDLRALLPKLVDRDVRQCRELLRSSRRRQPLAMSVTYQALETCGAESLIPKTFRREVVGAFSSVKDEKAVLDVLETLRQAGYRTLKWKVGLVPELDVNLAPRVLSMASELGLRLRIDANQAYSSTDARCFIDALHGNDSGCVELLEQPFGADEDGWLAHEELIREGLDIPIMMDESIIDLQDIECAARIGARWVKLKLIKHEGIEGMVLLANKAKALGLNVVLGNGVSTEIGNIYEALAALRCGDAVRGALESNGFARLAIRPTDFPVRLLRGRMEWENCSGRDLPSYLDLNHYTCLATFGRF